MHFIGAGALNSKSRVAKRQLFGGLLVTEDTFRCLQALAEQGPTKTTCTDFIYDLLHDLRRQFLLLDNEILHPGKKLIVFLRQWTRDHCSLHGKFLGRGCLSKRDLNREASAHSVLDWEGNLGDSLKDRALAGILVTDDDKLMATVDISICSD